MAVVYDWAVPISHSDRSAWVFCMSLYEVCVYLSWEAIERLNFVFKHAIRLHDNRGSLG